MTVVKIETERAVYAPSADAIFAGDDDWSSRPKRKGKHFLGFVLDDLQSIKALLAYEMVRFFFHGIPCQVTLYY
jgi:hypothetical protein